MRLYDSPGKPSWNAYTNKWLLVGFESAEGPPAGVLRTGHISDERARTVSVR